MESFLGTHWEPLYLSTCPELAPCAARPSGVATVPLPVRLALVLALLLIVVPVTLMPDPEVYISDVPTESFCGIHCAPSNLSTCPVLAPCGAISRGLDAVP